MTGLSSADVVAEPQEGAAHRVVPLVVPGEWTSVGERLEHLAAVAPDAPAVGSAGQSYTYAEMLGVATGWARALRRHLDDQPADRPVALAIEPDARSVVGLLSVVLSGRPVIPLDPMLPAQRIDLIVESSGAWRTDVDTLAGLAAAEDTALPRAGIDDPAVIFYTSGSTGKPKGLVHTHGCWLNQAYGYRIAMELVPGDRNALVLPLSFGGGLDVVFMSVLTGSSVLVHDPRILGVTGMLGWLRAQGVTTILTTPSMLRAALDTLGPDEMLDGVRIVLTCGEAIHAAQVERLRRHMEPDSVYMGLSGASEIGLLAYFRLPRTEPVPPGILPVGRPDPNKIVEVVGADDVPLGLGCTGEVSVTSRYLSLGYFGDPEMTAARFRRNADGTTTYRGGDLGQWDHDGNLHLKGRIDAAVKIGAYLVEPAEIEAAMMGIPDVREAVVVTADVPDHDGTSRPRLVAHVVPGRTERPVTPAALRRRLRELLPTWMVPARIVMVAELPRNERGKIDRPALSKLQAPAGTPPRTTTEKLLAGVWQSVLGLDEVGVDVDFWELGADSLAVEQLIVGVRGATGVSLGSADLTGAPTVEAMARLLDGRTAASRQGSGDLPDTAVRLRRSTADRPPVFTFAGGGAAALSMLPIATSLRTDTAVYGFQASGYESRGVPDRRVRDVVRRHLRTIRAIAPHGPYVLVGHSFGGILALETAALLAAAGEPVPLVMLLDTNIPDETRRRALAVVHPTERPPEPEPAAIPPRAERWRMNARLVGAGLVRYRPEVRDAVFWEQCLRMLNRHRLTTWSGATVVFTAPENTDDPAWWGQVLTGPHEVLPIDGGHSSILRSPFHGPIVERLDTELAALDPRHSPTDRGHDR